MPSTTYAKRATFLFFSKLVWSCSPSINHIPTQKGKTKKSGNINSNHLIKYGLIPEFVGRIGNIIELEKLTVKELSQIITDSNISPFLQYKKLLETEDIELEVTDGAVKKIANNCFDADIGARGIKNHFDKILSDTIYNIYNLKDKKLNKITIDKSSVDRQGDPIYNFVNE